MLFLLPSTYTGKDLGSLLANATVKDKQLIKEFSSPITPAPTIAILTVNLAPACAVIKWLLDLYTCSCTQARQWCLKNT